MKKTWLLVMCFVLLLTGCAGQGTEEAAASDEGQTVIRWMVFGEKSRSSDGVIREFNEQLQECFPGTTVEFEIVSVEDYKDRWDMLMAANEPLDIVWIGNDLFNYTEEVKKGSFMALDYLLKICGQELSEEIPEDLWEKQRRDGKLYSIPLGGALYRKDYAVVTDKVNLEAYGDAEKIAAVNQSRQYSDSECYAVFEEYLEGLKAAQKLGTGVSCDTFSAIADKGYEGIYGSDSPFVIKIFDQELKVYNKYELESYREYFRTMYEWYQKGYIRQNIGEVLAPENSNGIKNGNILFLDEYGESGVVLDEIATDYDAVRTPLQNYKYISYEMGRNALAIPRTTTNPQRAMEIINLMNSAAGSDLCKLLSNGLSGRHYVSRGENQIDRVTDTTGEAVYFLSPYTVSNLFLNYEDTPGEFDQVKKYNTQAYVSPLMGFELDTRMIVLEMAKIDQVVAEYIDILKTGTAENWEEAYAEMIQKMNQAGAQKVVDEMQRQLDSFRQ